MEPILKSVSIPEEGLALNALIQAVRQKSLLRGGGIAVDGGGGGGGHNNKENLDSTTIKKHIDKHTATIIKGMGRPTCLPENILFVKSLNLHSRRQSSKSFANSQIYYSLDSYFPAKSPCYVCDCENRHWKLIGGNYDAKYNKYVGLFRQIMPFVVCESCFREVFKNQQEPLPIGCVVCPEISPPFEFRILQALRRAEMKELKPEQICKQLGDISLDVLEDLLFKEMYLRKQLLNRRVCIDSVTGKIELFYYCNQTQEEFDHAAALLHRISQEEERFSDFQLQLARKPPLNSFGFLEDTLIEINVGDLSNLLVARSVSDFAWLREYLLLHFPKQAAISLPPIPPYFKLGRFNASFFNQRIKVLEKFLSVVISSTCFRTCKAVEIFFQNRFEYSRHTLGLTSHAAELLMANKKSSNEIVEVRNNALGKLGNVVENLKLVNTHEAVLAFSIHRLAGEITRSPENDERVQFDDSQEASLVLNADLELEKDSERNITDLAIIAEHFTQLNKIAQHESLRLDSLFSELETNRKGFYLLPVAEEVIRNTQAKNKALRSFLDLLVL